MYVFQTLYDYQATGTSDLLGRPSLSHRQNIFDSSEAPSLVVLVDWAWSKLE